MSSALLLAAFCRTQLACTACLPHLPCPAVLQWVDDFKDVVKEASGSRKKAAGRRSRQCEDVETAAALGAALVEALARLVRSHLRWQAREVAEGRELAMEDIDVVKVGRWEGWGCMRRPRRSGRAAGSTPQVQHVVCALACCPAVLLCTVAHV